MKTKRNRDGAMESIWQQYSSAPFQISTLETDEIYDAVVVGGGITGLTTAYLLQKAGKKVVLIEAANIGFGSTGGTTAHLSTIFDATYDEVIKDFGDENARLLAAAAEESMFFIKEMSSGNSPDINFKELPAFYFAIDESQEKKLKEIVASSNLVGFPMEDVSESPFPIPALKTARIENQGQFNPVAYIVNLTKLFQDLGGILIEDCRATGLDEEEIIILKTSISSIQCRNVVYATHIPPGVNLLHFRNAPYRSYAIAVKLKNNDYPDALAYDLDNPYHYYRSQQVGNEMFLIAGGEDHKTGHEENTLGHFEKLEAHLHKYYDFDEVSYKWSSQYYEPTDGLPYIGLLPGTSKSVYVATGFNGDGMLLGTLSGMIISGMITDGDHKYSQLFNPSRLKPVAGFSNFVKEAADVVASLIGGRFNNEQLSSISELARGEAKVVKLDGHLLAVYKDEEGEVHALNSACTHIKCTVGWNNAEKTWDCPCHGARYNYNGVVINGPARRDLEHIHPEKL